MDSVRLKYSLGDPNEIMANTLAFLDGRAQRADDRALITETKLWGDMDNFKLPNLPTERYDDSVPDPDLGGIAETYEDKLEDI